MDPATTAALINVGGDLLGGLFGKKSKGPDPVVLQDQLQSNANRHSLDYATKYPSAAAYGFKEAGIHPVYGLGGGAAMGQMPGVQIGGQTSNEKGMSTMQNLGQGLSRVASAYLSREEREIAQVSASLDLENKRLQNARLASEIQLMNAPGTPPSVSYDTAIPGQSDARYKLQSRLPIGLGDEKPLSIPSVDGKGNRMRVLNPDVGDNEALMAAHALGYSLPDWVYNYISKPIIDFQKKRGWHYQQWKGGKK